MGGVPSVKLVAVEPRTGTEEVSQAWAVTIASVDVPGLGPSDSACGSTWSSELVDPESSVTVIVGMGVS